MAQAGQAEIVGSEDRPTLELAIAGWLDAKANKSGDREAAPADRSTLANFRQSLWDMGMELDSDPRKVAISAQSWASLRAPGWGGGANVAPATFNQRLAIVSSFYTFGIRRGLLSGVNPI